MYVIACHTVRIGLDERSVNALILLAERIIGIHDRHVIHENGGLQTLHPGSINLFLYIRADIEQNGLRVLYQGVDTLRRKIRQNGNHHGFITLGCEEQQTPVGAVTAAKGYLVAFFDAHLTPCDMQFGYRARQFGICERTDAVQVFHCQAIPM